MSKSSLVSVVEDDRFFRESMGRLMRSLGYTVDVFASAADFLASPAVAETGCLIADVQMPAMTGLELYRHLIEAGHAIPTILVTAYPNEVDARWTTGSSPIFASRWMNSISHGAFRAALTPGEMPEVNS